MFFFSRSIIFIIIILENFINQSLSLSVGTLSNEYGRISNIPNDHIHVSNALTEANCIRLCVDFVKNHEEYIYEDCFAYNYDIDNNACELIHSIEAMQYIISSESRWKAGLKY